VKRCFDTRPGTRRSGSSARWMPLRAWPCCDCCCLLHLLALPLQHSPCAFHNHSGERNPDFEAKSPAPRSKELTFTASPQRTFCVCPTLQSFRTVFPFCAMNWHCCLLCLLGRTCLDRLLVCDLLAVGRAVTFLCSPCVVPQLHHLQKWSPHSIMSCRKRICRLLSS
jgi:hypothetical protein